MRWEMVVMIWWSSGVLESEKGKNDPLGLGARTMITRATKSLDGHASSESEREGWHLALCPGRMIGQVCASAGSRSRWILIGLMMRISARARTESRIRVVIGRAPSYEEPTVLMSSHCSTPTFLCTAQSSLPLPLPSSSSSSSLTQLYPYLPWNKSIYFNYRSISDWIKIN